MIIVWTVGCQKFSKIFINRSILMALCAAKA